MNKEKMKYLFKIDIKTILIVVLAIIVILMRTCGGREITNNVPTEKIKVNGKTYEVIKYVRDTIYVPKYITIYRKGKDIYHDTTIYVKVPNNVDTNQILKDFYAKNVFIDTLNFKDSLGMVTINDTISQNKILGRNFTAKINQKEIHDTLILKEPAKRQVYVGVNTSVDNYVGLATVGAGLIYKDKKDKMYQLGVGVINHNTQKISPYINGGMYWKIKLSKK